jgi:hypothetical protein
LYFKLRQGEAQQVVARVAQTSVPYPWDSWSYDPAGGVRPGAELRMRKAYLDYQNAKTYQRWYREHGYHFLVLTDHNFLTSVDALNALHGADDQFLVMKGEEVTDRFGEKPLHINGFDVARQIEPQGGSSVVDVLNRNVAAIRGERGVPHINHPNFGWAISREECRTVSFQDVRVDGVIECGKGGAQSGRGVGDESQIERL